MGNKFDKRGFSIPKLDLRKLEIAEVLSIKGVKEASITDEIA
jgi:hypothetical protein